MNWSGETREIQQLMGYVRSTVAGAPVEFDVIDQRAGESQGSCRLKFTRRCSAARIERIRAPD